MKSLWNNKFLLIYYYIYWEYDFSQIYYHQNKRKIIFFDPNQKINSFWELRWYILANQRFDKLRYCGEIILNLYKNVGNLLRVLIEIKYRKHFYENKTKWSFLLGSLLFRNLNDRDRFSDWCSKETIVFFWILIITLECFNMIL